MKKHRGLKRYYRNLAIQTEFNQQLDDYIKNDGWFDYSHWHFDWHGFGNRSFKSRKPHLDKLFRHFDLLVEKIDFLKSDFQLFVLLHDFDSSTDAIFLHTPNPNNSNFPIKWKKGKLSQTNTLKNNELCNYIEQLAGFEKLYGNADEATCILYRKGIGVGILMEEEL